MFQRFPVSAACPRARRRPVSFPRRAWLLPLLAALVVPAGVSAEASAPSGPRGLLRAGQAPVRALATEPGAPTPAKRAPANPAVEVAPALMQALAGGGRADFAIELRERADLSRAAGLDWRTRGHYVVAQLKATAERSQLPLRRLLAAQGLSVESHWIKNVLLVRQGDAAVLRMAAAHPAVARIRPMPSVELVRPVPGTALRQKGAQAGIGVASNIAWIGADQAWAQGTRGHGVTVGVIDTGAYHTHHALRRQYRGWLGGDSFDHDYNWFSPETRSREPQTVDTHGSHVIGTIVGDDYNADPTLRNRIGVAPGAKWIACLGLTTSPDNAANLLGCGEFMLAPTRTDGSAPNPDLRPQIVNNSWSENTCDGQATPFYADVVDAWVAAGIFPVFAAGNTSGCGLAEPPGLSTISSPASLATAFAVGSTGTQDGQYAAHSLWGPTSDASPGLPALPDHRGHPRLKPQLVAPGVDIVSAYDWSEDDYGTMTGTSMSAPHIAGVAALMLEAGECLKGDYATLGTLMMATATPRPYASGGDPAPGPGDVPNYATGWGEVDAAAAVNAAAAACGPQGFIAGTVTDGDGAPVAGARVELFVDEAVRVWEVDTEPNGSYVRRLPENLADGYSVRVSAYGFVPQTAGGLAVADQATTPHDVQLIAAARATISGVVRDAATGWPLHARLRIAGYPHGPVWTGFASGAFSVELPVDASFRVDVDSDLPGYLPTSFDLAVSASATRDVDLAADLAGCAAPGYAYAQTLFAQDFESGSPPAGWSTSSAGEGWQFGSHAELDQPQYWPIPPRAGRFAATIDPGLGNDGRYDMLVSPPIDLAGSAAPVLRFGSLFHSGNLETEGAYVEASTDGGASWQAVGVPPLDAARWHDVPLSLAAFAGQAVRLRFHYDDQGTDSYDSVNPGWAVDDVRVLAGCTPPADGGLVAGHVRDANTQAALPGALVSLAGREAQTFTSADPAVGEGAYVLHAPAGTQLLVASRGTQPAGYGEDSATLSVASGSTTLQDLALPAGLLVVDPAAPALALELGTVATLPLALRNEGSLPLSFALEGQHLEQHFEDGVPPAGWATSGNAEACDWSAYDFGNQAGGDGIAAGVYLWPCDGLGRVDTSLLLPPVDLSDSGTASLGFFLALHPGVLSDPLFTVEASVDAGASWSVLHTATDDTTHLEPFNLVELDLSAYAGEDALWLRLRYQATPPFGDVQVDQVHVFRELGTDGPLAISPSAGVIAAGGSLAALASVDARTIAQPGTYAVPVRVAEDTPYPHWFGDLTATLDVTAPASFGSVGGSVQSLGRCEADPAPLAGIALQFRAHDGTVSTTHTDAAGNYHYWLDSARGPYTVVVAASQHQPLQRGLSVVAGTHSAADLELRPDAPCVVPEPAALTLQAAAGGAVAQDFDLLNLGAAEGEYAARAGGDPGEQVPLRLAQTLSDEPQPFFALGCFDPGSGYTLESQWYRAFPLAAEGWAGETATLHAVRFAVDGALAAAGSQAVSVSLYRLDGPMLRANLTLLATREVRVPDTLLGTIEAELAPGVPVPLDQTVVVEIRTGDGTASGSTFYVGGNGDGDTAPGYFSSSACGFDEPVTYADFGYAGAAPIIELGVLASDVCGGAASPVTWLGVAPDTGTVPADGAATLSASANGAALPPGAHAGALCISAIGPGDRDAVLPVQLQLGAGGAPGIFANGFE